MTAPDLLERSRMALAEAGYPDAEVARDDDGDLTITTFSQHQIAVVPSLDVWRAFCVADAFAEMCGREAGFTCWEAVGVAACLADRPLVRDCGRTS